MISLAHELFMSEHYPVTLTELHLYLPVLVSKSFLYPFYPLGLVWAPGRPAAFWTWPAVHGTG